MPSDRRGRLPIPRRGPSAWVLGKANGSAQGDHAQCSDRESTESFHVLLSQWLSENRSAPAVTVCVNIIHSPYGVRRCTSFTTNAPLSGRARARVSGKRNRASGSAVYPEFHTTKTSSPITRIQWNRTLKSSRSFSLSYWTKASRLVRVLKSNSNH